MIIRKQPTPHRKQTKRQEAKKTNYKTILAKPDSREKFLQLERKLLKLQPHGADFFRALEEYNRLFEIYRH